jgi:trk system potassium uptake protein TrkA
MPHSVHPQELAVIGLGQFGTSLALKLAELGHSVLAIDRDRERVQDLADHVTQAVALDATDPDALRAAGIEGIETAVVGIGADFESNVLVTALLKELGVRKVICKALTERQRAVLQRVGADQVVLPEADAGARLARTLGSPGFMDRLELEPGLALTELHAPPALAGRSLRELNLSGRLGLMVLVLKGKRLRAAPSADEVVEASDVMLVLGPDDAAARLQAWEP